MKVQHFQKSQYSTAVYYLIMNTSALVCEINFFYYAFHVYTHAMYTFDTLHVCYRYIEEVHEEISMMKKYFFL